MDRVSSFMEAMELFGKKKPQSDPESTRIYNEKYKKPMYELGLKMEKELKEFCKNAASSKNGPSHIWRAVQNTLEAAWEDFTECSILNGYQLDFENMANMSYYQGMNYDEITALADKYEEEFKNACWPKLVQAARKYDAMAKKIHPGCSVITTYDKVCFISIQIRHPLIKPSIIEYGLD